MDQDAKPNLDSRINRFAKSLKKDFAPEIAKDPSGFRATVLGKLKPKLPRRLREEGLSWSKIASKLGLGIGTVVRAYRSRANATGCQNPMVDRLGMKQS